MGLGKTGSYGSGSVIIPNLKAGDTLTLRIDTTTTLGAAGNISIMRLSGPAQIAASETVTASYYTTAGGSASTTVPINFDGKVFDSHGAVTTGASWKFTAPISGKYLVDIYMAGSTASSFAFRIYKGGSLLRNIAYTAAMNTTDAAGTALVQLLAGETIDIRPSGSLTWAGSALLSSASSCIFDITRVGNY